MGEIHNLTGFQRDLLFVIADLDEPNGGEVGEELGEYYDAEIQQGRLYPNLDRLANQGMVQKDQNDRRTNTYTLTEQGNRALEANMNWKLEYIPEEIVERSEEVEITA